ncbi:hypothetical protein Agub_g11755 [Astrephomene gubernaculifera]|uniref:Uncharacterized protein n=1 Tax=Astrephomene gubernaculifera TaxID=47775 RepID=A0AAD3DXF4_9CHLO|nr:hypothetical protein Agub_g11755 [Astrephomene gubernaculifera]
MALLLRLLLLASALAIAVLPAALSRNLHSATQDGSAAGSTAGPSSATKTIVVLGDSLSDTGNLFNQTRGVVPNPGAYWRGRFSSGPNWVDHLAQIANTGSNASVTVLNYAYGGATACANVPGTSRTIPSLSEQLNMFLARETTEGASPSAAATFAASTRTSRLKLYKGRSAADSDGGPLCQMPAWPQAKPSADSDDGGDDSERLFVVFVGHNDLLSLHDSEWNDPRVVQAAVTNMTYCIVDVLDRLMASLTQQRQQQKARQQYQLLPDADSDDPSSPFLAAGDADTVTLTGPRDRVVLWNLAPLETAPAVPDAIRPKVATAVATANLALEAMLTPLRARYGASGGPGGPNAGRDNGWLSLDLYDIHGTCFCAQHHTAKYGFRNASQYCVHVDRVEDVDGISVAARLTRVSAVAQRDNVCSRPEDCLWYDSLHPTSLAQRLAFAEPFARQLGWQLG